MKINSVRNMFNFHATIATVKFMRYFREYEELTVIICIHNASFMHGYGYLVMVYVFRYITTSNRIRQWILLRLKETLMITYTLLH